MKEMGPLQGGVVWLGPGEQAWGWVDGTAYRQRGLWAGWLALLCLETPRDWERSLALSPTSVETPGSPSQSQLWASWARWKDSPVVFVIACGNPDVKDLSLWEMTTYGVTSSFRMGRTEAESSSSTKPMS